MFQKIDNNMVPFQKCEFSRNYLGSFFFKLHTSSFYILTENNSYGLIRSRNLFSIQPDITQFSNLLSLFLETVIILSILLKYVGCIEELLAFTVLCATGKTFWGLNRKVCDDWKHVITFFCLSNEQDGSADEKKDITAAILIPAIIFAKCKYTVEPFCFYNALNF